ncbi:MAG TPA: nucleoside-diphosphate kinase [Candidatus Paceibacterota bacterium]|jgi:nucleoside-diphosphate kinase|nr:nucleoside-diphosphate kinase [Candidatus Paceibacterota bacterium]
MIHEKEERSLIIIKPDAVQRSLVGEIITRFERKGLKIVAMKMIHIDDALVEDHYAHIKDKDFFPRIRRFMTSTPVIVMIVSGIGIIDAIRTIVGPTKSFEAAGGTIRGDFALSMQSNVVHASDSKESAEAEIKRFFKDEEIMDYEKISTMIVHSDELM